MATSCPFLATALLACTDVDTKARLLVRALAVLLLANAVVRFVRQLLPEPTLVAGFCKRSWLPLSA
jgi:hypothetical protein